MLCSSVTDGESSGRWKNRGKLSIPSSLQILPLQFIQGAINPYKFSIYNWETGVISNATRSDCEGLERCSVWYDNHIEDSIYAHHAKINCEWLASIDDWIAMATMNSKNRLREREGTARRIVTYAKKKKESYGSMITDIWGMVYSSLSRYNRMW